MDDSSQQRYREDSPPNAELATWARPAARVGAVAAGSLLALYTSGYHSACDTAFYLSISVASFIACALAFSTSRIQTDAYSTLIISILGMILSGVTLLVALLFMLGIL